MRKIKKIVDLSWEFTAETPIYPGDPEPSVTVATTLENEGYNLSTLVMGTQTGTHEMRRIIFQTAVKRSIIWN